MSAPGKRGRALPHEIARPPHPAVAIMCAMLTTVEIAGRLADGHAAVRARQNEPLTALESWLLSISARELLRVDRTARFWRHRDALGPGASWSGWALKGRGHVAGALAGMHADGRVREAAVRRLSRTNAPLADRMLAVRVADHVPPVRKAATTAVLSRTTLAQADRVVPLLHRIEGRSRGGEVLPLYLHALAAVHGESAVWSRLRGSADLEVRRLAFRHSLANGLLAVDDAVAALRRERDRIVQSLLALAVADTAAPDVVAGTLLHARSTECRALGLVRLTADQLDPVDVEQLLVDRGELVRLWARQRWEEQGRDVLATYRAAAAGSGTASVRARAYRGLVEAGGSVDHDVVLGLVRDSAPPLRKAGLRLLVGNAVPDDVPLLLDVVRTGTNQVARLASEVLLEMPAAWSAADLRPLAASPHSEVRRRAWWLARRRTGWDETLADLEILLDDDPTNAALGSAWSVPPYAQPTQEQRERLEALLPRVWPETWRASRVAFAAGLRGEG